MTILVVGVEQLAERLLAHGTAQVIAVPSIGAAYQALASLPPRSLVIVQDTAPLDGTRRRRSLTTAAAQAGHRVLGLASWDGPRRTALLPFGPLRSVVETMGPEPTFDSVFGWLGLQHDRSGSADAVRGDHPIYTRVPAASAVRGLKRINLLLHTESGEVALSGAFRWVRVGVDASAFCEKEHQHPRGIVDLQIPCFAGFSAHMERVAALQYGPSDGPIAHVALSGNVALEGPLASQLHYIGEHQSLEALELVAACSRCPGYTPSTTLSGTTEMDGDAVDPGWVRLTTRCPQHLGDLRVLADDLPTVLEKGAGRPVPVRWRTGAAASYLHSLAERQRQIGR